MEIRHDSGKQRFTTAEDGYEAFADYRIYNDSLDIRHTIVPEQIGGRGIASALVKAAYDYALSQGLKPLATCRYAKVWLDRHPEYNGAPSSDWCDGENCAL